MIGGQKSERRLVKKTVIPVKIEDNPKELRGIVRFSTESHKAQINPVTCHTRRQKNFVYYSNQAAKNEEEEEEEKRKKEINLYEVTLCPARTKNKQFKVEIPITRGPKSVKASKANDLYFTFSFSNSEGSRCSTGSTRRRWSSWALGGRSCLIASAWRYRQRSWITGRRRAWVTPSQCTVVIHKIDLTTDNIYVCRSPTPPLLLHLPCQGLQSRQPPRTPSRSASKHSPHEQELQQLFSSIRSSSAGTTGPNDRNSNQRKGQSPLENKSMHRFVGEMMEQEEVKRAVEKLKAQIYEAERRKREQERLQKERLQEELEESVRKLKKMGRRVVQDVKDLTREAWSIFKDLKGKSDMHQGEYLCDM